MICFDTHDIVTFDPLSLIDLAAFISFYELQLGHVSFRLQPITSYLKA